MNYQFVLTLWGQRYLDIFSMIVLPSLMTTGNLLGFGRYTCELDIYTTPESKQALIAMPILSALARFMNIRTTLLPSDDVTDEHKYDLMNYAHGLATMRSAEIDSVLVFLSPDAVFADGTLEHTRTLLESGKRAVLVTGQRAAALPLISDLKKRFNPNDSFAMQVSPRQLAGLLIQHPHGCYSDLVWGNKPFALSPAHILFPVAGEGYLLRGFLHHPLAVYPRKRGQLAKSTIDGRWLLDAVPDQSDWHLITDTDDACVVDVATRPDECRAAIDHEDPDQHVADWMAGYCDAGHHWMVKKNVYVHNGERSYRWAAAELLARSTVDGIFDLYERPTRSVVGLASEYERTGKAPLALFGAAELAYRVLQAITAANRSVGAIFDSDARKHGTSFGPLIVKSPSAISSINPSAIVILARGSRAEAQIRETIEISGFTGRIICLRDL